MAKMYIDYNLNISMTMENSTGPVGNILEATCSVSVPLSQYLDISLYELIWVRFKVHGTILTLHLCNNIMHNIMNKKQSNSHHLLQRINNL